MRRIVARIHVDSKEVEMVFITNNMEWAASSICGLYLSRWAIEVFFKQIKQTLQVCDFLGHSKQAIRWQLWSALLMYLLLRFPIYAAGHPRITTNPKLTGWGASPPRYTDEKLRISIPLTHADSTLNQSTTSEGNTLN